MLALDILTVDVALATAIQIMAVVASTRVGPHDVPETSWPFWRAKFVKLRCIIHFCKKFHVQTTKKTQVVKLTKDTVEFRIFVEVLYIIQKMGTKSAFDTNRYFRGVWLKTNGYHCRLEKVNVVKDHRLQIQEPQKTISMLLLRLRDSN